MEGMCPAHEEMMAGVQEIRGVLSGTLSGPPGGIMGEIAQMRKAVKEQGETLQVISRAIVGNGAPGYGERLRTLERSEKDTRDDRDEEERERKKRKWGIIVGASLIVVTQIVILFREWASKG
jgi:hypothetical protein